MPGIFLAHVLHVMYSMYHALSCHSSQLTAHSSQPTTPNSQTPKLPNSQPLLSPPLPSYKDPSFLLDSPYIYLQQTKQKHPFKSLFSFCFLHLSFSLFLKSLASHHKSSSKPS